MILVVTGTDRFPFDRLVRAVDEGADAHRGDEELLIQLGSGTVEPESCEWQRLFPFDEFMELLERADVVVGHAGAGTILLCLQAGLRPVVMPRRKRLGECVDDHQLLFAKRLHALGLVRCAAEPEDVWPAIEEARRAPGLELTGSSAGRLVSHLDGLFTRWKASRVTE